MQETIQKKTAIQVDNVQSDLKKITLVSGKAKFFLWLYKQDGNKTKAFEGFEQLQVQAGKAYEAEVEFEEKEFVNEKGKTIKFTSRKILYFYTGSPREATQAPTIPVTPQDSSFIASNQVKALEAKTAEGFKKRDDRINELETRLLVVEAEITELRNK